MICKGNTHKNGAKLARYITTAKDGERAELWQLAGFAAGDIREAFRSVHVIAEATRCQQPFFHVQVRNPADEELSRDEWRRVADRIESKLGLTGQPRAIAFHIDEQTGHEHMHAAWSRIDGETMTARPLPFFKERLKEVARELEKELDLTRVKNERDSPVRAPSRDEFEQARRLGVDIQAIREVIRECWDHSDNGHSFRAALAERGLMLTQGDRRDFVVLDPEGGLHALGKRVLGVSAAQTRDRFSDLDRGHLPTVEQGRQLLADRPNDLTRATPERMPDPYRESLIWEDKLARAAIEKEKTERRFAEAKGQEGGRHNEPDRLSPLQNPIPSRRRPQPAKQRQIDQNSQIPTEQSAVGFRERPHARAAIRRTGRAVGDTLDFVGGAIESLFAPTLTPKQKWEAEIAARERRAGTEEALEIARHRAERDLVARRQEEERDAARHRQREDRDR